MKEINITDITEMSDDEIDALTGAEKDTTEAIIEKFAAAAMELYKRDDDALAAMHFLKSAGRGCMKGRGDWGAYTMAERNEIRKELKTHWRAIAVHNARIDDLFRSA